MFNKKIISLPKLNDNSIGVKSTQSTDTFFLMWFRGTNYNVYIKTLAETFLKAYGFTDVNDTVNGKTSLEIAIVEDKNLCIIEGLFYFGFNITKERTGGDNAALYQLLCDKFSYRPGMVRFVVDKIFEMVLCLKILELEKIADAFIENGYPNFALYLAKKLLRLPLPLQKKGIISARKIGASLLSNNFPNQALSLAKKIFSHPNGMGPTKIHYIIWMGEVFALSRDLDKVAAIISKLQNYPISESSPFIIIICMTLWNMGYSELAQNIIRSNREI